MIIDFHTHAFPDALAPRAIESLSKINFNGDGPYTDGTAAGSERLLRSAGISRAVVCNIATNAKQEHNVNSFAISLTARSDFFSPLGSLHPDSTEKEAELDRLLAAGIRGVKLHPDYVRIALSDERYTEIFGLLEERGMFATVHAGFDPVSPDRVHTTADMLLSAIKRFPRLKLIGAHMGGFRCSREVLEKLVGTNVYIDTSLSALRGEETEALYEILKNHSPEKILFGTDTPWSNPESEIAFVERAPISDLAKEKIFSQNAISLLGIG